METEGSALYDPEARLVAPLRRFLEDLRLGHRESCQALAAEDPQALRALEIRVKAVYALRHEIDFPGIAGREEALDAEALESNPLIRCFLPEGAELPPAEAHARQTLWLLAGNSLCPGRTGSCCSAPPATRGRRRPWPPWGKTC